MDMAQNWMIKRTSTGILPLEERQRIWKEVLFIFSVIARINLLVQYSQSSCQTRAGENTRSFAKLTRLVPPTGNASEEIISSDTIWTYEPNM